MPETTEHRSWRGMIERCENPRHVGFKYYGERGITVCPRWRRSFASFLADMGPKPSRKHTIERINTDGNYEPTNCKWATPAEQRANQRPYDEGSRVQRSWDTGKRSRISAGRLEMAGLRYSRLVVLKYAGTIGKRACWLCHCDCGRETVVAGKHLRSGNTQSCGCLNSDVARQKAFGRNTTNNPAFIRWAKEPT